MRLEIDKFRKKTSKTKIVKKFYNKISKQP